jgi:aminopeptidase N
MKKIFFALLLLCPAVSFSQQPASQKSDAWKTIYRATSTKINDLVNTKLDVSFDFSKSWMYGKAWITLKPHFYPTDSLTLDAKMMEIKEVSVIKEGKAVQLKYTYDSLKLHIALDKTYKGGENYTIFIDYISRPNDIS